MITKLMHKGVMVTLSDMYEGSREASYQIEGEEEVKVECGDLADLKRIAARAVDAKLDPSKIKDEPASTEGAPEGQPEQEHHEEGQQDWKPSAEGV